MLRLPGPAHCCRTHFRRNACPSHNIEPGQGERSHWDPRWISVDDPHAVAEPIGSRRMRWPHGWTAARTPRRRECEAGVVVCFRMYSNAMSMPRRGYPPSAPAMSQPTTPLSRTGWPAPTISRDPRACRIAVHQTRPVSPALGAGLLLASGEPPSPASTTARAINPRHVVPARTGSRRTPRCRPPGPSDHRRPPL